MPSRSGQAKSLSCDQAHIDTSRWMHRAAGTVMNAPGAGLQGPASTAARNGMTLDRRRGPAYGRVVHLEHLRPNVLTVTLTTTELSALVAGARMALDALRARPDAVPQAAITTLARAVEDYDRARLRLDQNPPVDG